VAVVPADAVVEVPGSGFLRAYHAWRLDRSEGVRETLGRLFGVDVPFAAWGEGDTFEQVAVGFTEAEIPAGRVDDVRAALEEARSWPTTEVTGERKEGAQGTFLIPDPRSVAEAAGPIGGLGTRVFVDPTSVEGTVQVQAQPPDGTDPTPAAASEPPAPTPPPVARIDPSTIRVEVLNGGEVELAATKTSERLEASGYPVVRIADHNPQDRPQSFVHFRAGGEEMARQVGAELGYPVEPLPPGVTMKQAADVLVLLGHDAKV
jgi:hypothetical protein